MTRLKKVLVWVVLLALMVPVLASAVPVTQAAEWGYTEMYVKTDNGKSLTVREKPNNKSKSLGNVKYGEMVLVDWSYAGNDGWVKIVWDSSKGGEGYIQARYLVNTQPEPYHKPTKKPSTPKPTKKPSTPKPTKSPEDIKKEQEELNRELKSEKEVEPYYIEVRPQRSTGWINFRVGPSTITSKITSYAAGKELIVLAETRNWYRARDPETNKIGYIYKSLTAKLNKKLVTAEPVDGTTKLGRLTVNGEFDLTCKLPEGYSIQVVSVRGQSIIAAITSEDITKPQLYLSIAYDELYGEVGRMNELTDEDLAVLESSFTSEYQVEIEYRETAYGTKLLVAREVGDDTDFVDILSIYKGYLVEFNMTPNPKVANQALTEEQIRMCIDFLTDVNFVPVQK